MAEDSGCERTDVYYEDSDSSCCAITDHYEEVETEKEHDEIMLPNHFDEIAIEESIKSESVFFFGDILLT